MVINKNWFCNEWTKQRRNIVGTRAKKTALSKKILHEFRHQRGFDLNKNSQTKFHINLASLFFLDIVSIYLYFANELDIIRIKVG